MRCLVVDRGDESLENVDEIERVNERGRFPDLFLAGSPTFSTVRISHCFSYVLGISGG